MEFRVLGALEAGSGGAVVDLGPPKQRALLAILLLHVGEIVPVDRLIDLLWGEDPPRTAGHSIQIYISELRKALEPLAGQRLILRRQPGYQLDAPADSVDANRFESLVQQGSAQLAAGEREGAIATLRSALDCGGVRRCLTLRTRNSRSPTSGGSTTSISTPSRRWRPRSSTPARPRSVVPLLEAAIREDPLRERSRELLMVALYRSGRHAEALRSYEKLRELLVEELGLEPSPPLQQLRDRVLLHDPSLLPLATRPAVREAARNPYKGLQPFGEQDAGDFFGRDSLLERLLAALAAGQRLIGLVGPSGSGKSSVVAAGLIPRLRGGALPGSDRWIFMPVPLGRIPWPTSRRFWRAPIAGAAARIGPAGRGHARRPRHRRLRAAVHRRRRLAPQRVPGIPGGRRQGRTRTNCHPLAPRRLLRPATPARDVRRGLRPGRDPCAADDREGAGGGRRGAGRASWHYRRVRSSSPSSWPRAWPVRAACHCSSTR